MKNLTYLFVLLVAMFATGAQADTVGSMTTFSTGTPAIAGEVNGNFNAVATAVDANDALINAIDTSGIAINTGSINSLSSTVDGNIVGIVNNANAIGAIDTSGIATNTAAITNLSNGQVATNATNVSTNGGFINSNASGIGSNSGRLDTLEAASAPTAKVWRVIASGTQEDLGTFINYPAIGRMAYLSDKGYVQNIRVGNGNATAPLVIFDEYPVYFSDTSCGIGGGQAWAIINPRQVFNQDGTMYYSNNGGVRSTEVIQSISNGGNCLPTGIPSSVLRKVYEGNVLGTTGVFINTLGTPVLTFK